VKKGRRVNGVGVETKGEEGKIGPTSKKMATVLVRIITVHTSRLISWTV